MTVSVRRLPGNAGTFYKKISPVGKFLADGEYTWDMKKCKALSAAWQAVCSRRHVHGKKENRNFTNRCADAGCFVKKSVGVVSYGRGAVITSGTVAVSDAAFYKQNPSKLDFTNAVWEPLSRHQLSIPPSIPAPLQIISVVKK